MVNLVQDYIEDVPSSRDYLYDDMRERADWQSVERPKELIKLFDQWRTPKCTWFALQHIVNWNNILEDLENKWEVIRDQFNPNEYVDNRPHYLQDRLNQFKELDLIQWYVSIPKVWWRLRDGTVMSKQKRNELMKEALTKGFLYTGTSYVKRTTDQDASLRFTDNKQTWHAFPIVDYSDWIYTIANSFWLDRWDAGYGYVSEHDVDKLFTCYLIVDKKDTEYFKNFRVIQKAKQAIKEFKELYEVSPRKVQQWFEDIQLTATLEDFLKFEYNPD